MSKQFHSQYRQDEFLEKCVFKGFRNGTFVDVGAHDGITFSNTLYFERTNGWSGINIEANPHVYEKLAHNRPDSLNIQCAVCKHNGTAEFVMNTGYTEMLSGLKGTYDPRHMKRLNKENETTGGTSETILVHTRTLERILDAVGIKRVHYLSIDTEGAEEDVIRSINFDRIFIDVIGFENNFTDTSESIIHYLSKRGYRLVEILGNTYCSDTFMIHKDSQFIEPPKP